MPRRRPPSAPPHANCTCPPSAPKPPAWPRSPTGNGKPTSRYLAEVLAAEVDDRTERRRTRRINDAKFPRLKRLADFNIDAVPTIQPATLGHLAAGHYLDAGEPIVLLGDSGTGKSHLLIGLGLAACEQGRRVRYVTTAQLVNELVEAADERSCPASSAATAASTCSASTNSATSKSTHAAPNCCSRSSPNAKNEPPSPSPPTCPSANGAPCSPTRAWSPRSSTASPSTPTSSKPAPSPTGCAPARPPPDASAPADRSWLDIWWHSADMPFPASLPADLAAGRWQLRALTDDDWRLERTMSRDPEVVRWTLYPPDLTEESARERVHRTRQRAEEQLATRYAVLDHDGIAIGTAGIACSETGSDAEVFYALLPHGRHRGAATAAARALTDMGASIGMQRVLLITIPGNSASEAVARRAGFVPEGEETRDQHGAPTRMLRWSRTTSAGAKIREDPRGQVT